MGCRAAGSAGTCPLLQSEVIPSSHSPRAGVSVTRIQHTLSLHLRRLEKALWQASGLE
jgi:hypothetical protein